jgi:hypothetical protein
MQNLINQIEALGLRHRSGKKSRTMVNSFEAPNGDVYATYSSGYVRRIYMGTGYFSEGQIQMYQLNPREKGSSNRIMLASEADRLNVILRINRKRLTRR